MLILVHVGGLFPAAGANRPEGTHQSATADGPLHSQLTGRLLSLELSDKK